MQQYQIPLNWGLMALYSMRCLCQCGGCLDSGPQTIDSKRCCENHAFGPRRIQSRSHIVRNHNPRTLVTMSAVTKGPLRLVCGRRSISPLSYPCVYLLLQIAWFSQQSLQSIIHASESRHPPPGQRRRVLMGAMEVR